MRALSLFGLFGLLTSMAACSAAPQNDGAAAAASTDDALSSGNPSYVTVRRDQRRCEAPLCGGYFVQDVNRSTAERYVASLDFVKSGLDDASVQTVLGAADGELVLNGRLSNADPVYGTRNLLVFGAWRGMPGVTFDPTATTLYTASDFDPPVECFAAPCPEGQAQKLNSWASAKDYTDVDVSAAVGSFVDGAFVRRQVVSHGAIVAANIVHDSAARTSVLTAQQVFIKLPVTTGPCPELQLECPPATPVETFTRTDELCLIPVQCVTMHICAFMRPSCPAGYTLNTWANDPLGCPGYTCDPTFVTP
jgi:hypothetical protein